MTFGERKAGWSRHAQSLIDLALGIIGQCDQLTTAKGSKDPKVIALALLSRSLGHFRATFRLLEDGSLVEARTLTRCIFENLFLQRGLAESGDAFVTQMAEDNAKSRQSRGTWVLDLIDERTIDPSHGDGLRRTMDVLRSTYPKPRSINYIEITRNGPLSSDAAHPSLEALSRHIAKEPDGSLFLSIVPTPSEKDLLDAMEWACQAFMGVILAANQIAGQVEADRKLSGLFDEFNSLADAS